MTTLNRKRMSWLNSGTLHAAFKIASAILLGLYLNAVVLNNKDGKFKNVTLPDLGLVAMVLIYTSDALSRLHELKVGSNDLELSFDQKKAEANKDANQKEASALVLLGEQIADFNVKKEFFSKLLYDGEKELLERLILLKTQGKSYLYNTSPDLQLDQKLLHLSALNFIRLCKECGYSCIGNLKGGEDLTEIFEITEEGKKCLAVLAEGVMQSSNGKTVALVQNQQN